ncbi:M15 family metallopeptidase [Leptothoe sp. PORK10 BA2]|uniref:M15 family metallopeptidase n=1 Tax=Leptothoe sp. PORK10 BA2 TaxID=3110254 RepID=UPI002B20A8F0|nr:M15 family metallopeptidase [Leptothoe sp. PORK10 BA2]MEA5462365.1 M15 family metallopeptidase [Leptothoe sp. PORK10 BA2]
MDNFIDDIPEARRDTLRSNAAPAVVQPKPSIVPWLLLATAVLGLAGLGIFWLLKSSAPLAAVPASNPVNSSTAGTPTTGTPITGTAGIAANTTTPPASNTEAAVAALESSAAPSTATTTSPGDTNLLGHRPYDLANTSDLVALSTNSLVLLKPEAAQKVETMIAEARAAGIGLDVISGFRSLEDQQYLFFDLKAERGQTTQARAEVSAPPGYSEHHTGYVVDFIDANQPGADLNTAFDTTQAFRWLNENAAYYGFEMSFPKNNAQNVAYEPWHWRYVGNQESLELFYQE